MSVRNFGNPPLLSTTAAIGTDPSTATLAAEVIIPLVGDTNVFRMDSYEVRFGLGASTGALWRLEVATGTGLSTTSIRFNAMGTQQRINAFTGSNLSAEFVLTLQACPGDRFRARFESTFTGTYAAWIQAEAIS